MDGSSRVDDGDLDGLGDLLRGGSWGVGFTLLGGGGGGGSGDDNDGSGGGGSDG